jgi:CheY-like chemotaxis protein
MACILLAEPDLATRNFLAMRFREAGFEVDVALNGHEAVVLLSIRRHDLIISGFELMGKSGLEVLREIRQHPDYLDIPFVLFGKVDTGAPAEFRNLIREINELGAVFLPKTAQHLRNFPIQSLVHHLGMPERAR